MDTNNDMKTSIQDISNYFVTIVDLISAHYYVPKNETQNSAFIKRKKGKESVKDKMNKKLLSKKAKLFKLDPSEHKTSSELQMEVERKEEELFVNEAENHSSMKPVNVTDLPSASLDELREKLNNKIKSLQGKRRHASSDKNAQMRKRKQKNKEVEIAKLKKMKETKNIETAVGINERNYEKMLPKNENGEIVFSKFDFITENSMKKKKKKKGKDNLPALLEKAEKKKLLVETLEKKNKEKADDIKRQNAWIKVQKKAEGIKLKDDPKLLKKALKNKEKRKEKSQKKWNDRLETIEKQKQELQKLRKKHLKERRENKINKIKQAKKKKQPGF